MMAFARRFFSAPPSTSAENSADIDYEGQTNWQISAADRFGAAPSRKWGKIARRSLVIFGASGAAYALYDDPAHGTRWWASVSDVMAPAIERALQQASASSKTLPGGRTSPEEVDRPTKYDASAALPRMPEMPGPNTNLAMALQPEAATPVYPIEKTTALPAARPAVEMPAYAPPEKLTVVDPFEARAKAAGLHPELSRALLAQLTDADFRNAGIATRRAVEKMRDDETFKWPRHREAGLATFEVRFVAGAPPDCRRYVVTVEKNRWLTTALPVETCGVHRR